MRLLKLLLVAAVCLGVSVSAFAHSGRTDSSGGHTNHSTGEYHYHHGHPAHQHSDIDGDGELDCPYDFNETNAVREKIGDLLPGIIFLGLLGYVAWYEIKGKR
jgi:hypothetical protein